MCPLLWIPTEYPLHPLPCSLAGICMPPIHLEGEGLALPACLRVLLALFVLCILMLLKSSDTSWFSMHM